MEEKGHDKTDTIGILYSCLEKIRVYPSSLPLREKDIPSLNVVYTEKSFHIQTEHFINISFYRRPEVFRQE